MKILMCVSWHFHVCNGIQKSNEVRGERGNRSISTSNVNADENKRYQANTPKQKENL